MMLRHKEIRLTPPVVPCSVLTVQRPRTNSVARVCTNSAPADDTISEFTVPRRERAWR